MKFMDNYMTLNTVNDHIFGLVISWCNNNDWWELMINIVTLILFTDIESFSGTTHMIYALSCVGWYQTG